MSIIKNIKMWKFLCEIFKFRKEKHDESSTSTNKSPSFSDLPFHLIEKILQFNFHDRHQLSLVCKTFYEAICKIYGKFYILRIDIADIILDKRKTLKGLSDHPKNCNFRSFASVILEFSFIKSYSEYCTEFLTFLEVRGNHIKRLEIRNFRNVEMFQQILVFMKNIEMLIIVNCFRDSASSDILDLQVLSRLWSLKISRMPILSISNVKVCNNLLKKVDLLIPRDEVALRKFLLTQTGLKEANIEFADLSDTCNHNVDYLGNCKLKKFKVYSCEKCLQPNFISILQTQTEIAELTIENDVNIDDFAKIEGLAKLKTLAIGSLDFSKFEKNVKNVSVLTLKVNCLKVASFLELQIFKSCFPNVKILYLNSSSSIPNDDISQILDVFDQLEQFHFFSSSHHDNFFYASNLLNRVNINLHTLILTHPIKTSFEFLEYFPNLVEIHVKIFMQKFYVFRSEEEAELNNRQNHEIMESIERLLTAPSLKRIFVNFSESFEKTLNIFRGHEVLFLKNYRIYEIYKLKTKKDENNLEILEFEYYEDSEIDYCCATSVLMAKKKKHLYMSKENFKYSPEFASWLSKICSTESI